MLWQPEGLDGWHSLATPGWKGRCGWYEPGRRGQRSDVVPAKPRDTLTGTFRYANTYADAIALVATGHIDLKPIITGHYTLEETEQALQATKSDPANIKSVVVPK